MSDLTSFPMVTVTGADGKIIFQGILQSSEIKYEGGYDNFNHGVLDHAVWKKTFSVRGVVIDKAPVAVIGPVIVDLGHSHEWVEYNGLTDKFNYCKSCGEKK